VKEVTENLSLDFRGLFRLEENGLSKPVLRGEWRAVGGEIREADPGEGIFSEGFVDREGNNCFHRLTSSHEQHETKVFHLPGQRFDRFRFAVSAFDHEICEKRRPQGTFPGPAGSLYDYRLTGL
jgi:hypothetical protein